MAEEVAKETHKIIDERQIGDRQYQLLVRPCSNCGCDHHEIWRFCGALFARWRMKQSFERDDFDEFIALLDDQLLVSSHDLLNDFHYEMEQVNSPHGIQADWAYSFRLMEYARQRASLLKRVGALDFLLAEEAPVDERAIAIRAAFELGHAAAERRFIAEYEDYLQDGFAMSEWREAGLPKARLERIRLGEQTRTEVLKAARSLYEKNPALQRNDTETARQILKLNRPRLQKANGRPMSLDAITRHLRESRRQHDHGK